MAPGAAVQSQVHKKNIRLHLAEIKYLFFNQKHAEKSMLV